MLNQQSVIAVPSYHPNTVLLIGKLNSGKYGDVFTDKELTEFVDSDTSAGGKGYGYLMSAIRYCERYHNIVWRRIRGEGKILCLDPIEILELSHGDITKIRKQARRGSKRLFGINQEEIEVHERPQFNAAAAQLGFIASFSSGKTTKKLMGKCEQPKLDNIVELFK